MGLSRTVIELTQLIVKILDTAFLSHPGGLGTTYDVHLGLIGKCVVDFLLVLIELNWTFFAKCTPEALRTKIENRRFRSNAISLTQNFTVHVDGVALHLAIIFAQIVRPMNALQLVADIFHTKQLCSRLTSIESAILYRNRPFCILSPPLGYLGLGATYNDHLIGSLDKCVWTSY